MSRLSPEILHEYIQETREHLAAIEPDLLRLEEQGAQADPEVVNRVFRAVHSAKGGATFLGIDALTAVSHAMEHVLAHLRDGTLTASSNVVDVLLRSVDILRVMVDDVDNCSDVPCERELAELHEILERCEQAAGGGSSERASAECVGADRGTERTEPSATRAVLEEHGVAEQDLAQSLARGMRLYAVDLTPEAQAAGHSRTSVAARVDTIGSVLGTRERCTSDSNDSVGISLLCATVVDADMLRSELALPSAHVRLLDTGLLRRELRKRPSRNPPGTPEPEVPTTDVTSSPEAPRNSQDSLRVRLDVLNRLMNVGGELVLARNQLLRALEQPAETVPGLTPILQNIDRITSELQEGIMQTRMQPVGVLFARYPRVVRDLARQLDRRVTLQTSGADVELDKSIVEALVDPLTHIVRNCISHGVESPAERAAAGKVPSGCVSLRAFHESGQVTIEIADDGRGVSLPRVLDRAIAQGLVDRAEAQQLSEQAVLELALRPGFSTADEVSDVSGRGVGLDVVRTNVERLGGHVDLQTEPGQGTMVALRLPLTLAIIPSLIVGLGDARFAVPQAGILELVWVQASQAAKRIEEVEGVPVLRLRDRLLPLVRLAEVVGMQRTYRDHATGSLRDDRRERVADRRSDASAAARSEAPSRRQDWRSDYSIVVLRAGANRFGIIVDELFDNEEIVIKPLPAFLEHIECFAGTTILGDGRVTMILDPSGLATRASLSFSQLAAEEQRRAEESAARAAPQDASRSVILVDAAPGERFAVPQDRILRVERIERSELQQLGGQEYVQYRDSGLKVIRLDRHFPISSVPADAQELFLLLPKDAPDRALGDVRAGVLVWQVVDTVEVDMALRPALFEGPGVVGTGIIGNSLTTFFDPVQLVDGTVLAAGDLP